MKHLNCKAGAAQGGKNVSSKEMRIVSSYGKVTHGNLSYYRYQSLHQVKDGLTNSL